jgi:hypothetical protein
MRRRIFVTFLFLLVGLVAFKATQAFQSTKPRTAYTITRTHEGVPTPRITAVRADGSQAIAVATPEDSYTHFGDRRLVLRPQQLSVYILDKLKLKSTETLPPTATDFSHLPLDPTCANAAKGYKFLAKDSYLGFDAYIYSLTAADQSGQSMVTTLWLAPQLDCTDLQAYLQRGSRTSHNYVTSIKMGEPDPSLFDLPSDYTEVKPSDLELERAKALGLSAVPATMIDGLNRRDEGYANNHNRK